MASLIHGVDETRRVTLGDLRLSSGGDPTCTTADGLDYYSLHLYPQAAAKHNMTLETWLRNRMAAVPQDGAAVVIEEMFPLGGAAGASFAEILRDYVKAPRATGWMSFYWGTPKALNMSSPGMYEDWLHVWSSGRPFKADNDDSVDDKSFADDAPAA